MKTIRDYLVIGIKYEIPYISGYNIIVIEGYDTGDFISILNENGVCLLRSVNNTRVFSSDVAKIIGSGIDIPIFMYSSRSSKMIKQLTAITSKDDILIYENE